MIKLKPENLVMNPEPYYDGKPDIMKEEHHSLDYHDIKRQIGVYYLMDDNDNILYVGSSVDPFSRIKQHHDDKKIPFSRYYINYLHELNKPILEEIEYDYILLYCPKYNQKFDHPRWMSESKMKEQLKNYHKLILDPIKISELLSLLRYTIFNGKIYYDSYDIIQYLYDEAGEIIYGKHNIKQHNCNDIIEFEDIL